MIITESEFNTFLKGQVRDPHSILGIHPCEDNGQHGLVVRAFNRDALRCEVVELENDARYPLERIDSEGFFEGFLPEREKVFRYRLRVETHNGEIHQYFDPYSFLPSLNDDDLYLFNEGNEHRSYEKLGAHLRKLDEVEGVSFAVWAPNARGVSVVGEFNYWDGRVHRMRSLGSSGIWEIFIPGLQEGLKYKFEVAGGDGSLRLKSDPYGTYFESPPHNASIICDLGKYEWGDEEWMKKRESTDWQQRPVSIYEMHVESWKRVVEDGNRAMSYLELADELVPYLKDMGFTHVEFMPLAEHPFSGSWGYQVTGFFAVTHRFGTPDEFRHLVDVLHQNDIGVIIDWVPGHFPMDSFALPNFDGTALYEHADPRQGVHQDWGTFIFNYGRNEVSGFLISNALSWLDRFHIDGLRVDAVASMLYLDYSREDGEWIANQYGGNENLEAIEFIKKTNALVHQYYPGVMTIAEESTAFSNVSKKVDEGGLGFDFKWNMGWMHDTLEYFSKDALFRKWHHNNLTFGMMYQYSENFIQVFSHDEVVHGKCSMMLKMGAGTITEKAQTLRALYALMWAWPGKNTLFMGSEFGQTSEWRYDRSLDWHLLEYMDHEGVQNIVRDLNDFYTDNPGLYEQDNNSDGFEWVSFDDVDNSVVSFIRRGAGDHAGDVYLAIGNYTPVSRSDYRVGVPYGGFWKEAINSNSSYYGGNGIGNLGGVHADAIECHGRPCSLNIVLPGNSTLIFKWSGV